MSYLHSVEEYWRDLQPWLESCGYQLRPRYRVGWIPSWISSPSRNRMDEWTREDHLSLRNRSLIDATRIRDGMQVMLKKIPKFDGNEKDIVIHLASPPSEGLINHCLPIEEVLAIPGDDTSEIIVMRLMRSFDSPRFDTIGECVDLFVQAFKGLQFVHHHHVAHRDCTAPNLMMDASEMFPQGFHPADVEMNRDYTGPAMYHTRLQRPPTYYWIDFGLSVCFDKSETLPRVMPLLANDRTVPEFQDEEYASRPYDPFLVDVYYLGNLIREYFIEGHKYHSVTYGARLGLEFMKPLVEDMVQEDPAKRPTIDECVVRLEEIIDSLSSWKLRSQVCHSTDNIFGYLYRFFPHWFRRMSYIIRRIPPIPVRKGDTVVFKPSNSTNVCVGE